ncbi:hypothetical protein QAD02_002222 [Eretmocerus hayati]|uniref:Uncharacterized protein n=1 Tax=Eretmocerus hayati TaxID=131215 RepID=A0ACC2NJ91_9HYME|nr:hypothetical protein QAD02_002222 [Eretmocerus hayati]
MKRENSTQTEAFFHAERWVQSNNFDRPVIATPVRLKMMRILHPGVYSPAPNIYLDLSRSVRYQTPARWSMPTASTQTEQHAIESQLQSPRRDKSYLPDLLDKDEESNLTDQSSKRSDTEEGSNIETPDEQGLPNIITPTQNPTCNQKKKIPYNITHDPDSSSSSDESFIPDAQSTKRWSKNLPEISKPDKSQTYWWDDEPMNKDNAHSTFSNPNLHSSNSSLNKSTTSLPAYLGAEQVSNEIVEE